LRRREQEDLSTLTFTIACMWQDLEVKNNTRARRVV
jgi:hypothetical protein